MDLQGDGGSGGSGVVLGVDEAVKEYKIHVSSKYLERTRKKLELTRLPHELAPKDGGKAGQAEGGEDGSEDIRKTEIEPLIDYWLEQYSWRTQESHLNTIPQYRTPITLSPNTPPLRLHFVHIPSPDPTAIPLLLIPPFPFTNLSLEPLIKAFTATTQAQAQVQAPVGNRNEHENQGGKSNRLESSEQAFHLIIPSIPGLGFSDPFNTPSTASYPLKRTAQLFNTLMVRLGYDSYITSTTSSSSFSSPSFKSPKSKSIPSSTQNEIITQIPTYLALHLSKTYSTNCIAIHLIDPYLRAPRLRKEPLAWLKLDFARVVGGGVFGYEKDDINRLEKDLKAKKGRPRPWKRDDGGITGSSRRVNEVGSGQSTVLSFALCDSPVGMLAFTLDILRSFSSQEHQAHPSPPPNPPPLAHPTPSPLTEPAPRATPGPQNSPLLTAAARAGETTKSGQQPQPAPESLTPINDESLFSDEQTVSLTQLSWLPGPEALLRFLQSAAREMSTPPFTTSQPLHPISNTNPTATPNITAQSTNRPLLGITTFSPSPSQNPTALPLPWLKHTHPISKLLPNVSVVSSARQRGERGLVGFLAPDEVVSGIREFGAGVCEVDGRLGGRKGSERKGGGGGNGGSQERNVAVEERGVGNSDGDGNGIRGNNTGLAGRGAEAGETGTTPETAQTRTQEGSTGLVARRDVGRQGIVALDEGQSPDTLVES